MFINLPGKLKDELKTINVIITGGGTGGHVYPAIAVGNMLREDIDVERVIYVGCPDSLEEKVAAEHEFDFLPIRISGMPRKFSFSFLKWLYKLNKATVDSLGYLLYVKPDVVFATGGYVSGPVLLAALILDVPYVIHEADAYPGLVNRVMSAWADRISVAFDQAKEYMKNSRVFVNGNPLRASIGEFDREEGCIFLDLNSDKKTMLVLGGSQGARQINEAVIDSLPSLLNDYDLQVIHQCGPKNYDEIKENLPREVLENPSYILKGYIEDLAIPMAVADFAISRAGSMSLSELAASRLPSILVPYPYAAQDHQRSNARYFVDAGAAFYLENEECDAEKVLEHVDAILSTPDKLDYMRLACSKIARKKATENIISMIKEAANLQVQDITVSSEDN